MTRVTIVADSICDHDEEVDGHMWTDQRHVTLRCRVCGTERVQEIPHWDLRIGAQEVAARTGRAEPRSTDGVQPVHHSREFTPFDEAWLSKIRVSWGEKEQS